MPGAAQQSTCKAPVNVTLLQPALAWLPALRQGRHLLCRCCSQVYMQAASPIDQQLLPVQAAESFLSLSSPTCGSIGPRLPGTCNQGHLCTCRRWLTRPPCCLTTCPPWAATWAAGLPTGLPAGSPSSPQPPKPTQSRPRPATREMTHRNRCAWCKTAVHLQGPCEWHSAAASNCHIACTEPGVAPAAGAAHKCSCKPPEPLNISRCLCREHTPFEACLSLPVASLDLNCLECATRCGHCASTSIPLCIPPGICWRRKPPCSPAS